jgi:anthranilate phosphoribosyltransferase
VPGPHFVDIVGTGGDGAHTFNISTAADLRRRAPAPRWPSTAAAACRRSSGSADVLEALGANINLSPEQVAACIETGIGFMFAPNHHPAMKNVAPVRRELGVRTIFNILGPLTNPAGAPNTLMGVFHPDLVGIQVRVMQRLGAEHVLVVHGKDGMDEMSLGAATLVGELKDGEIREYEIHPEDFGLSMLSQPQACASVMRRVAAMLLGARQPAPGTPREIVCLNAGAALYAANLADRRSAGIALARETIASAPRAPSSTVRALHATSSPAPEVRMSDILQKISPSSTRKSRRPARADGCAARLRPPAR